jgi:type 1 glutamine amidotransferase
MKRLREVLGDSAEKPQYIEIVPRRAVRHFPKPFVKYDEIYQAKDWSRDKVDVLLSLDPGKLNYENFRVHRADHDFAVAWSKMYGKGRVFYSSFGHTQGDLEQSRHSQDVL